MTTIAIREVDERLYKKFKSLATEEDLTTGQAVNGAMELWISHLKAPKTPLKDDSMWQRLQKPMDWGVETDSGNLDEEIY